LRKIILILTVVFISFGCAVKRKHTIPTSTTSTASSLVNLNESIVNQNLTSRSFYIGRAEFKIKNSVTEKSGLGTVKFLMPDKFLISLKSNTGIEVARIFLSGDSVMVNDRFNKRLYYGSTSFLKSKFGITAAMLPVLLGDYVNDQKYDSSMIKCTDGKLNVIGIINNHRVKYLIECELEKIILTVLEGMKEDHILEIRYSEFIKRSNINSPGKIEISERKSSTTIEIRIQEIVSPWNGVIDFIPGKQYEKIHLL
jgi:hypothetical protein